MHALLSVQMNIRAGMTSLIERMNLPLREKVQKGLRTFGGALIQNKRKRTDTMSQEHR